MCRCVTDLFHVAQSLSSKSRKYAQGFEPVRANTMNIQVEFRMFKLLAVGNHSQDEILHVHYETKRLAQESVDNNEPVATANGYCSAANLMLELMLPFCAEKVLKHAKGTQQSVICATRLYVTQRVRY